MYFVFGRTFIGYWRLPDDRICWFASLPRTDPLTSAEVGQAGDRPAMPTPEEMFAPLHRHHINWHETVVANRNLAGV
jgi:hypothetical protein